VPVRIYRENWDRMVAGEMWGDVPRGSPYIGVQGDPEAKEAKIVRVEPGQPGDRAGLRAGDTVLKFGDKEVQDFATLAALVADAEPGTKVPLEIRRGEETKVLELVIGRRN
jgi:serine protease Do